MVLTTVSIHVNQSSNTELWREMAREVFPGHSTAQLDEIKMWCSTAWCFGEVSERTQLYEQYVIMKSLKGID